MVDVSDEERKELCLWRRALQFCTTNDAITVIVTNVLFPFFNHIIVIKLSTSDLRVHFNYINCIYLIFIP